MNAELDPMRDDERSDRLAPFVGSDPPAARVEREWSRISGRLAEERRRVLGGAFSRPGLRLAALVGLVVLVAIGVRFGFRSTTVAGLEGTTVESEATGQLLRLPDGAELRLAQATSLRVTTWSDPRVVLALDHGEITVDVPHVAGRTWIVTAGAYDVRVVGTRFVVRRTVDASGDVVAVEVERGRVEVARRDGQDDTRSLAAGESWRAVAVGPVGASQPPSPPPVSVDPAPPASASDAPAESAPPAPSWEDLAKARRYRAAYDALGAEGFTRAMEGAGPDKLFLLAEVARAAGHLRDAERAFDALRTRHRGDGRAGLAAFELGRLRLDGLGNPGGAAQALADAIALAPGAPFREDAEARRVQALEASGARGACASAREAYLARYPSGAHAATVRTRCPDR